MAVFIQYMYLFIVHCGFISRTKWNDLLKNCIFDYNLCFEKSIILLGVSSRGNFDKSVYKEEIVQQGTLY